MSVNSLEALDRRHWVHPVANWAGHEKRGVTVMKSAKGGFITDADGHELIDGFAGLWCVNVGYGHESIVEAAARQFGLDFVRLLTEDYVFVCRRAFLDTEPMRRVIAVMKGQDFHRAVATLPGYVADDPGTVSTVKAFLDSVNAAAT